MVFCATSFHRLTTNYCCTN